MNFAALKEFRKNQSSGIKDALSYLSDELAATIRELRAGLQRLSFQDNFQGFTEQLVIAPATEIAITNRIDGAVPSFWLILRKNEGGLSVCEGDQAWNLQTVYLKNTSATVEAIITVRFFR